MKKGITYEDIMTGLENGDWEILDIHYFATIEKQHMTPSEAVQSVREDITAFANTHYDGRGKRYKTVMDCLSKWEQAVQE